VAPEAPEASGQEAIVSAGGAGGLEVAPGVRLVDTPELPEVWKPNTAHRRITVAD